jgi:hypothetical protein
MISMRRSLAPTLVGGVLWAVVYAVVWGIAWLVFMRSAWYAALGTREMPWTAIWSVWAALNVPLGVAVAAYLRRDEPVQTTARPLISAVLVLWAPMTIGMVGWAWYESLSLALITIDSVVNLVGLVAASWAARVLVRRSHERHALAVRT